MALPLFRGVGQKGKLIVIGGGAMNALLGLHYERPAPVQIDKAARLGAGVDEGDRAFKAEIVTLRIRGGGVGGIDVQQLGQLNRELLKVGAL